MSSEETPSATLLPDPIFARQGYIAETADLSLAISIVKVNLRIPEWTTFVIDSVSSNATNNTDYIVEDISKQMTSRTVKEMIAKTDDSGAISYELSFAKPRKGSSQGSVNTYRRMYFDQSLYNQIVDPTNSVNETRTASGRVTGIRQPRTEPVDEDLTDLIPSSLRGPIDCQNTKLTSENIIPRDYYYPK
ncbi:hypothetical protein V866_001587 [Kwoniella sp. B9012]